MNYTDPFGLSASDSGSSLNFNSGMFGQNVGFNGFTFNSSVQTNNSRQTGPASSSTLSEKIHKALDAAGFLGDLPDAINAIIYLIEGNYKEAGWAAVPLLPFGDAFSKSRKVALNAIPEAVEFAGKYGDDIVMPADS